MMMIGGFKSWKLLLAVLQHLQGLAQIYHCDKSAGRESRNHLRQCHREDLSYQDHEERITRSGGRHVEAGDVVKRQEEAHGTKQ